MRGTACIELLGSALTGPELLIDAAKNGDARRLLAVIESGVSLASADELLRLQRHHHERCTLLHWASAECVSPGHAECIRTLVAHRADVNASDLHGWTPLMAAVSNHQADAVRVLLAASADPTRCDRAARTALDHATRGPGSTAISSASRECVVLLVAAASAWAAHGGTLHAQDVALEAAVAKAVGVQTHGGAWPQAPSTYYHYTAHGRGPYRPVHHIAARLRWALSSLSALSARKRSRRATWGEDA